MSGVPALVRKSLIFATGETAIFLPRPVQITFLYQARKLYKLTSSVYYQCGVET